MESRGVKVRFTGAHWFGETQKGNLIFSNPNKELLVLVIPEMFKPMLLPRINTGFVWVTFRLPAAKLIVSVESSNVPSKLSGIEIDNPNFWVPSETSISFNGIQL